MNRRLRAIDWTDHEARLMKLLNTHYRADQASPCANSAIPAG